MPKKQSIQPTFLVTCLAALTLLLSACESETPEHNTASLSASSNSATEDQASNTDAEPGWSGQLLTVLVAPLEQAQQRSETLLAQANAFVKAPTQEGLNDLLTSWQQTHDLYRAAGLLRRLGFVHPELDVGQHEPEVIHPIHVRLDQFPLIPGYLDSVPGYPMSGIIFSEKPITREFLNAEHQFSDKHYVALGFHAMKQVLTGTEGLDSYGSVNRFAVLGQDNSSEPHTPGFRRSLYLLQLAEQIHDDLKTLLNAWQAEHGFYQTSLRSITITDLKARILDMIRLVQVQLDALAEQAADDHNSIASQNYRKKTLLELAEVYKAQAEELPSELEAAIQAYLPIESAEP